MSDFEPMSLEDMYDLALQAQAAAPTIDRLEVGDGVLAALRRFTGQHPPQFSGMPPGLRMTLGVPVVPSAELGSLNWQALDRDGAVVNSGTLLRRLNIDHDTVVRDVGV